MNQKHINEALQKVLEQYPKATEYMVVKELPTTRPKTHKLLWWEKLLGLTTENITIHTRTVLANWCKLEFQYSVQGTLVSMTHPKIIRFYDD